MELNWKFPFKYSLPALLTALPFVPFSTEEITGCINEAAESTNKTPRNPPSCFFISCFSVSGTPSINTPESSNDFIILIISFISSFKINKVTHLASLAAPFLLIFLSNLFIALEVKLLTNLGKLSLAKRIATFISVLFPKLANQEPKDPPDWIILDIWAWLNFISLTYY